MQDVALGDFRKEVMLPPNTRKVAVAVVWAVRYTAICQWQWQWQYAVTDQKGKIWDWIWIWIRIWIMRQMWIQGAATRPHTAG